jgi:hypothetical protein
MNAATNPGATKPGMKDQARDLTAATDAAADAASGGCGVQIRYLMNHCAGDHITFCAADAPRLLRATAALSGT